MQVRFRGRLSQSTGFHPVSYTQATRGHSKSIGVTGFTIRRLFVSLLIRGARERVVIRIDETARRLLILISALFFAGPTSVIIRDLVPFASVQILIPGYQI